MLVFVDSGVASRVLSLMKLAGGIEVVKFLRVWELHVVM
jgi:hypothetical protein